MIRRLNMLDVIIIGAGITGAFIARELARYELDVMVLEKNNDIANETTMANSAIIHSGYDPIPGSNKARLNVEGNSMYEKVCFELDCAYKKIGSLTVAIDDDQVHALQVLEERARENQVEVKWLDKDEALQIEPNLTNRVKAALLAPSAAIVYPWEVAIGLMENAMDNGVKLFLNQKVTEIKKLDAFDEEKGYKVTTDKESYKCHIVINCAGVFADSIHNMTAKKTFEITPRRGQYFVLDSDVGNHVRHVIFPCPTKKGKGVLVTPTTHGNILIGPTSETIEDKFGNDTTSKGLDYVRKQADSIVKNIPYDKVIRTFAGLRPSSDRHDFIIGEPEDAEGFIDVAGIESPGLASAPAIAREVLFLVKKRIDMKANRLFDPHRQGYKHFKGMSIEEKREIIKKDARYGKIICRCETVTEGEIVDCIRRNAGATTVKGVKKRVRPGMGRCQGGFCEPLVLAILDRELGLDPTQVNYDGIGSTILMEETKRGACNENI